MTMGADTNPFAITVINTGVFPSINVTALTNKVSRAVYLKCDTFKYMYCN